MATSSGLTGIAASSLTLALVLCYRWGRSAESCREEVDARRVDKDRFARNDWVSFFFFSFVRLWVVELFGGGIEGWGDECGCVGIKCCCGL